MRTIPGHTPGPEAPSQVGGTFRSRSYSGLGHKHVSRALSFGTSTFTGQGTPSSQENHHRSERAVRSGDYHRSGAHSLVRGTIIGQDFRGKVSGQGHYHRSGALSQVRGPAYLRSGAQCTLSGQGHYNRSGAQSLIRGTITGQGHYRKSGAYLRSSTLSGQGHTH